MIDPLTGTLAATAAVVAGVGAVGVKAMNKEGNDTFEQRYYNQIRKYELEEKRLRYEIEVLKKAKQACENEKPASTPTEIAAAVATPTTDTAGDPTEESVNEAVTGEPANESEGRGAEPAGSALAGLVGAFTGSPTTGRAPVATGTVSAPATAPVATGLPPAEQRTLTPLPGTSATPGTAATAPVATDTTTGVPAATQRNLTPLPATIPTAAKPEVVPGLAAALAAATNDTAADDNAQTETFIRDTLPGDDTFSSSAIGAVPGTANKTSIFQDGQPAPQPIRTPGFIETQEEGSLGCGRHALNNFLGGQNFIKDNGTNIQSIQELTLPVSLQTLCRYITPPGEQGYCPDNELYDYQVLRAGLNLFGYEVDTLTYPVDPLPIDVAGFLVRKKTPEHWVVLRKEQDETFTKLDSLDANPEQRPLAELEVTYLKNVGKTNTNDSIYTIKKTGQTRDIKPGLAEVYGTPLTQEQRVAAAKARAEAKNANTTPSTQSAMPVMSAVGPSRIRQASQEVRSDIAPVQNMRPSFFTKRTRRNAITKLTGQQPATLGDENSQTWVDNPMLTTNVPAPKSATPPPAPSSVPSPADQAAQTRRKAMKGTPNPVAIKKLTGQQPFEIDKNPTTVGKNPLTPVRRGVTMRKKKLRTRRATKQKNVRGTRSR